MMAPRRSHPAHGVKQEPKPLDAGAHLSETTIADEEDTPMAGPNSQADSAYASNDDSVPSWSSGSIDALGRGSRNYVEIVNKLEQLGVEASGFTLPKIVAVGDQSAGKSSLIEAISEIRVPRASNTCTRCPIQISLVRHPEPSWKVTIHRKYSFYPGTVPGSYEPHVQDFGPWKVHSRPEDGPSVNLTHASEVEEMIARAQTAILHPSEDPLAILQGQSPRGRPQEFSPNVVKLDIAGPNLPTLMLYDLPGIISQSHTDDDSLPELIRGLARDYVRSDNTIVLLACPIGTDMVNSNAASLVQKLGALPRCAGVITKPDKLDNTDLDQWDKTLSGRMGKNFQAGHGFWVTKQPNSDQTSVSHEKARQEEAEFFIADKRWNSTQLSQYKERFGTIRLREKLSDLLEKEIMQELPKLERQVSRKLAQLEARLLDFPKPEDNAYPTVLGIVSKIESGADSLMHGDSGKKDFLLAWKAIADKYCQTLKEMKPVVVVNTGTEPQWQAASSYEEPISLDSDEEDATPTPRTGSKRSMPPPITPTKRQRTTPSGGAPRSGRSGARHSSPTLYTYPPFADALAQEHAVKWTLEEIRQAIKNESISGIPRATDPNAEDSLIKTAMGKWEIPLAELFQSVTSAIKDFVLTMSESCVKRWENTELHVTTQSAIEQLLANLCDRCHTQAKRILQAKLHKPFTLNTDVLEFYQLKELAAIKKSRRFSRAKSYIAWKDRAQNKRSEPQDMERKAHAVKDADMGEDPYAAEIEVMSRIRAYYNLAAGNVVDCVGEMIQMEIFEGCTIDIKDQLGHALRLNESNCIPNANRLLAEDPERLSRREELEREKEKLEKAQRLLSGARVG